jgi:hypothetical protein
MYKLNITLITRLSTRKQSITQRKQCSEEEEEDLHHIQRPVEV